MDDNNRINSSVNDFIHSIRHASSIDHDSYDDDDRNNDDAFDVDVSFPNVTTSSFPLIRNDPSIICSNQDNNDGENDNDRNNNDPFDADESFPNATISSVPFIQNAPSIICSSQDNDDGENNDRYNNNSCNDNDSNNGSTFDARVSFPNVTTSSVPFIQNVSSINCSNQDNDDGENDNRWNNRNELLIDNVDSQNQPSQIQPSQNQPSQNMNIQLGMEGEISHLLPNDSIKNASMRSEFEHMSLLSDNNHEPLYAEVASCASNASQSFFVEGAEGIYQNVGLDIFKLISNLPTADLRRPLLSIVTKHSTRHQAKILLQRSKDLVKKEWTAARKHCRFPGAGWPIPPKPKYFRKKLNEETISDFLQWMYANDFIQNVAFGHKVVSYCNGVHTAIEAVKLTSSQSQIIRIYAKEWQENNESMLSNEPSNEPSNENDTGVENQIGEEDMNILESSNQCCCKCPKTGTQCFREKNHQGRHSFTPKGRLSPSTISKLLSSMTAGKIKSLAGLDDTDTTTGLDNFENMKALIRTLSDVGRSPSFSKTAKI